MLTITQLKASLLVLKTDDETVNQSAQSEIARFEEDYENDFKQIMIDYSRGLLSWARRCLEIWEDARSEVKALETQT